MAAPAFPTKRVCYEYELIGRSNERTEESTEADKHRLQDSLTDSESTTIAFRYLEGGNLSRGVGQKQGAFRKKFL